MKSDHDGLIAAALLWDWPTLVRSGRPEARVFADVFRTDRRDTVESDADPTAALVQAAAGIRFVLTEDLTKARLIFESLKSRQDPWESLLGMFGLAWSGIEGTDSSLQEAAAATRMVGNRPLQSRLLRRLSAHALDRGLLDDGRTYLTQALRLAPSRSHLRYMLQIEGINFFKMTVALPDWPPPFDRLVEYSWIRDRAADSAQDALEDSLKERSRDPWRTVLRFGRGQLANVTSAELQATWAGVLSLRREIRKQAGAQFLMGGASTPDEMVYGATMWALGGGGDLASVIKFAEPSFDERSADQLVRNLWQSASGKGPGRRTLVECALALWDLLSPEEASRLVDWLEITGARDPMAADARHLFCLLGLVNPVSWTARFEHLSPSEQRQVMDGMTAGIVIAMPSEMGEIVAARVREYVTTADEVDDNTWLALAQLVSAESASPEDVLAFNGASEVTLAVIHSAYPTVIPPALRDKAALSLEKTITKEIENSLSGSRTLWPHNPFIRYAQLLDELSEDQARFVDSWLDALYDDRLPADLRFDVLSGLKVLGGKGLLQDRWFARLQIPITVSEHSVFIRVSRSLIEMARLSLKRLEDLTHDDELHILISSRDSDPRVRQVAVSVAGGAVVGGRARDLASILIGGLYDPEPTVLIAALREVFERGAWKSDERIYQVVARRLPELARRYGREVRERVALAAKSIRDQNANATWAALLCEELARDRSWIVRRAVLQQGT